MNYIAALSQLISIHLARKMKKRVRISLVKQAISITLLISLLATQLPLVALSAGPPGDPEPQRHDPINSLTGEGWQEVTVSQIAPLESKVNLFPNEPLGTEIGLASQASPTDSTLSAAADLSFSLLARPEYLNFLAVQNSFNPATQPLYLRNTGGGTINYTIQEDIPWLSLNPTSGSLGSETDTVTVSVDVATLQAGDSPFLGTITINDLADPANTRQVRVRLSLDTIDRRTTLYSYDSNGNLQRRIDANRAIVDYEYDSLNRLTRIAYPDNTSVSYTYDANGNRTAMTDAWGTTNYTYDDFNRLTEVDFPNVNPIKYKYDQADNLTQITYPDGTVINYGYDTDNRLTTVTDASGTTTYGYDSTSGNLTSKTLPNGIVTTYDYDVDGRLIDVTNKGPGNTLISAYHYPLDDNGMRTAVEETTPAGTQTTTYGYDALNRLDRVTYPDGRTVRYEYDQTGNRLKMIAPEETTTYTYDADNRLRQAGDEQFFYDRNGNLTSRATQTQTIQYSYDHENRLTRYNDGQTEVQFIYDGDGNRIAKIVDGVRTNYVNDVNGLLTQVLAEADAGWQTNKTYTLGLDRISQHNDPSDPSFYLYDSPGRSVTGLADASGTLVNTYKYDAFGERVTRSENIENIYTYNGEQNDPETGLIYLRNRYYDPHIGRFLTPDPLQGLLDSPQSLNPYSFVENNPINFIDPLGLASWKQRLWEGTVATIGLAANIVSMAGAGVLIAAPEPGSTALGLFIVAQSSLSFQASYAQLTNALVGEKVLPDNLPGGIGEAIGEIAAGDTGKDLGKAFDMGIGIFTGRITGNAPSRLGDLADNLDSIIGSSQTTWESGQKIKNSLIPYFNNEPSSSNLDQVVDSALDAAILGNLDIARRNGYFPPPRPPPATSAASPSI